MLRRQGLTTIRLDGDNVVVNGVVIGTRIESLLADMNL